MKKSLERQAYRVNNKEKSAVIIKGIAIICFLSFFFYQSFYAIPALLPIFYLYQKEKTRELDRKKKRELSAQFKDAVLAVSANLKAGYSVENAFRQTYKDMEVLYGRDSLLCKELYIVNAGLNNNLTLEKLLLEFGKRSGVEDIWEFAEVFASAKRSGGSITEIMERSAVIVAEKMEIEKEIQILISARRMEQKIMNMVPFGIILYIGVTSKGFFDPMYHNAAGICIMTICLAVYVSAVLLSRKIVDIDV